MVKIIHTIQLLQKEIQNLKAQNKKIGFVPTMGALHQGHGKLIQQAKEQTDYSVVSIFVNPKQFAPYEDLSTYPRPIQKDIEFLENHKVDILFLPDISEIYPENFMTKISITGILNNILEAKYRPHFFDGVSTVVTKLFMTAIPDIAFFGEKDYQQLCIIKQLTQDLAIPISIQAVPTIRDQNGLALSSRNQYLSKDQYQIAITLNKELSLIKKNILNNIEIKKSCDIAKENLLRYGFTKIDYISVHQSNNLEQIDIYTPKIPYRILAAGYIDNIRLIDNL